MSKSRAKGTFAESAVVDFLRNNGFPHADRRPLSGAKDRGDILVAPGVIFEVKSCATITLAAWLKETEQERINANAEYAVLVTKPNGVGITRTGRWLAFMYLGAWKALVKDGSHLDRFAHRVISGSRMSNMYPALDMALQDAVHNDLPHHFVTMPPRGRSNDPDSWYTVTHLSVMVSVIRDAGYGVKEGFGA